MSNNNLLFDLEEFYPDGASKGGGGGGVGGISQIAITGSGDKSYWKNGMRGGAGGMSIRYVKGGDGGLWNPQYSAYMNGGEGRSHYAVEGANQDAWLISPDAFGYGCSGGGGGGGGASALDIDGEMIQAGHGGNGGWPGGGGGGGGAGATTADYPGGQGGSGADGCVLIEWW